jgi:Holliday junction resolvase RusA-like endonuclease
VVQAGVRVVGERERDWVLRVTALSFVVPGKPVPKGRPRGSVRDEKTVVMRTPKTTEIYETRVAAEALRAAARQRLVFNAPVVLSVRFLLPRPKELLKPGSPAHRIEAPDSSDGDNLVKAIADGMQPQWKGRGPLRRLVRPGVLANDSRIVVWLITKAYVALGEEPSADVTLATLEHVGQLLVDVATEVGGWSVGRAA